MKKRFLHLTGLLIIICLFVTALSCAGRTGGQTPSDPSDASTGAPAEAPTPTPDLSSFDYSEKTLDTDALAGKYKLQGRCPIVSYKPPKQDGKISALALDYSACSVEFRAFCEGDVTAEIYTAPTDIGGSNLYLNVYIDGVRNSSRADFCLKGRKVNTVTLASGLERGLHTFKIERQTEAERGLIYINSITLSGELTDAPENAKLFIEFIGDSITTGYGNLYPDLTEGEKDSNQASNVYQDGTKTYAYITAANLGADYSIVAQQGIGVTSGYYAHTMLGTYTKTCYQCNHKDEWGFDRKADAVVINLGTNDYTMSTRDKLTPEEMQKGFEDFCSLVREKNPESKIVWVYGMMNQGAEEYIRAALEASGGESAGFYFVKLESNGDGGNGHPSAAAHEANAEILTKALKDILG